MPKKHSPDLWDSIAAEYDALRPDQGLTEPGIRAAWRLLFEELLPTAPSRILDIGCGTGSLSLLLVEMGHDVIGIDFAPQMIAQANRKAERFGSTARFDVQDASAPDFPPRSFDAIVCRQVLWALPDREPALSNWAALLAQGGRMLLVEGRFSSGNGMAPEDVAAAMPETMRGAELTDLAPMIALWGGPIPDQRVLVSATRLPGAS
jgi:ubiquinone/menaquinone biosynthesis C-methylase UbiE